MPGFDPIDFPFMVLYEKDTYNLLNCVTGHTDVLINDSARNDGRWPATFFKSTGGDKLEMHFCTSFLNDENSYEHTWHCMEFNADFTQLLKKHYRLPIDSIDKQMEKLGELKRFEETAPEVIELSY